jgi:hypothetical protein
MKKKKMKKAKAKTQSAQPGFKGQGQTTKTMRGRGAKKG